MGGRRGVRTLALVAVAIAVVAPLLAFLGPDGLGTAANLAQVISPVLAVPALVALLWSWRAAGRTDSGSTERLAAAADRLAEGMRVRWTAEAAARGITLPAPVRVEWERGDGGAGTDDRIPGVSPPPIAGAPARRPTVATGPVTCLHDDVYVCSAHGRLVLVGPGGCGKTGALLLLLLAALAHRRGVADGRASDVPVPVWVSLASWDVSRSGFLAWVAVTLERDHPYLCADDFGPDAAAALLRSGRVALFLDGFDELSDEVRVTALRTIERESAGIRLVLTSRTEEYRAASVEGRWSHTEEIHLRPVRADEAARYLLDDQVGDRRSAWRTLTERLGTDPDGVPASVLRDPLRLSLARDAYRATDPAPLAGFTDRDALDAHLLDRMLRTAYPDPADEADVRFLARVARASGQRDLAWWTIPRRLGVGAGRLALLAAVAATLVAGAWCIVVSRGFYSGQFVLVGAVGAAVLVVAWRGLRRAARTPTPPSSRPRPAVLHRPSLRQVAWALVRALGLGLAICAFVLAVLLLVVVAFNLSGPPDGPITGNSIGMLAVAVLLLFLTNASVALLLTAAVTWPLFVLRGMVDDPGTSAGAATPRSAFRGDLLRTAISATTLFVAITTGLALLIGAVTTSGVGASFPTALNLSGQATAGFVFASLGANPAFAVVMSRLVTRRIPRRGAVAVLERAADRSVLRRVGTVYQFRHAALQSRLAGTDRSGPG